MLNNYKQRILTAAILIPLFVALLFVASEHTFYWITGLVTLWGAWEWSGLMAMPSLLHRVAYVVLVCVALFVFYLFPIEPLLYLTALFWSVAAFLVATYQSRSDYWREGLVVRGVMGVFVLVPCWLSINFIRLLPQGHGLLLFLFLLIWAADSAAYFGGKRWGHYKLLKTISPGKTWEGFGCALLTAPVISLIGFCFFKQSLLSLIFLSFMTIMTSVLGDLFESMCKRAAGVKDSGRGLPGHGGILDRIDSLTAAAPLFALGMVIGHWT